jgi:hypothetical protein
VYVLTVIYHEIISMFSYSDGRCTVFHTNGLPAMKNSDALGIFFPDFFPGKYKPRKKHNSRRIISVLFLFFFYELYMYLFGYDSNNLK